MEYLGIKVVPNANNYCEEVDENSSIGVVGTSVIQFNKVC